MADYNGIFTTTGPYYIDADKMERWMKRCVGEWFIASFNLLSRKIKDPKTREQLGLYWALLLIEITKALQGQGHSVCIETMPGIKREVLYTKGMVHEGLTLACGLVGENGTGLRLSEMDKLQASLFIDHVHDVARHLKIDIEKMRELKRSLDPELRKQ